MAGRLCGKSIALIIKPSLYVKYQKWRWAIVGATYTPTPQTENWGRIIGIGMFLITTFVGLVFYVSSLFP
jgi:hypothetical protein